MSVSQFVGPSISLSVVNEYICPSECLSVCSSVRPFVCLLLISPFVHQYVCLFVGPSVCLSVVNKYICPSVYLSVCLSADRPFVSLSV